MDRPVYDADVSSNHWMDLSKALPSIAVDKHFHTEGKCIRRLKSVRWPKGLTCSACGSSNIGKIKTRKPYQCRECRHQFSVTSGTICHRSHLDLQQWFIAAEMIISANVSSRRIELQTSERLKQRFEITYKVAFDLRKKLRTDLILPSGGLIGRCICVKQSAETQEHVALHKS
ncbi:transposase [Sulfitobacter guttiformis]|uniref:Transposase-like zinc ribbon protein n=1 Tax=Sulfitobacter guttiformis TaxID=74349 RepID=A0A420DN17_9RHOB|nr:transposase [Sulfitobacter guttiformis]RKE95559.1 transposase-like zinc ribbon protein [Sulfitobacter guttiformis]